MTIKEKLNRDCVYTHSRHFVANLEIIAAIPE